MAQSKPALPDSLDELLASFEGLSREDWLRDIESDIGDRDVHNFLQWQTGEGIQVDVLAHPQAPVSSSVPVPEQSDWLISERIAVPDAPAVRERLQQAANGGCTAATLAPAKPPKWDVSHADEWLRALPSGFMLHLDGGSLTLPLLALFSEAKVALPDELQASADPVADFARTGNLQHTSWDALASAADSLSGRLFASDGRPYHNAGASMISELALMLSATVENIDQLTERGLSAQDVLSRHHYVVGVERNYLLEIAKLRALRLLHENLAAAYDIQGEPAVIFAETSARMQSALDEHENLLRTTTSAAAAILGGCRLLTVRPFDERRNASDRGQRWARNIQHILDKEAYLGDVRDPARGSYLLEKITEQLAEKAWSRFQEIEADGGIIDRIQSGTLADELSRRARERQVDVASREDVLVGVNHYPPEPQREEGFAPPDAPVAKPAPALRLPSWTALRQKVQSGTLADFATEAKVAPAPSKSLKPIVLSAGFEALRARTERHVEDTGHRPLAFLVPFGKPSLRSARANFSRNVLAVAGFEVRQPVGFETAEEGLREAIEQSAQIAVLCGADAEYAAAAETAQTLMDETSSKKQTSEPLLVVAGSGSANLKEASVAFYLHRGMNVLETLSNLQDALKMDD